MVKRPCEFLAPKPPKCGGPFPPRSDSADATAKGVPNNLNPTFGVGRAQQVNWVKGKPVGPKNVLLSPKVSAPELYASQKGTIC